MWAGIPAVSFFLACFISENWLKAQQHETVPDAVPVAVPESVPVTVPTVSRRHALKSAPDSAPDNDIPKRLFAADIRHGELPRIREIKARAKCGTPRAQEIRGQLTRLLTAEATG